MQLVKPAYGHVEQSRIAVLAFVVAGLAIVATGAGLLTAFGQTLVAERPDRLVPEGSLAGPTR
jgi:hypothetical protein